MVAEKAGIVRVKPGLTQRGATMELIQEDTVRKVLEIVVSGTVEPGTPQMEAHDISDGTLFKSIEQGRGGVWRIITRHG